VLGGSCADASVRARVGYLPEDAAFPRELTVFSALRLLGALQGMDRRACRAAALRLLEIVGLGDRADTRLSNCSRGMLRRFGLAQAWLHGPDLVLLDEPTAGLDPEERNRFLNLLAEIGEQVVVILSTHIVEDVTDLCPRMAIIAKGEVLLTGEPIKAIEALKARVWRKVVAKETLARYQSEFNVLSTRLVGGRPVIHVYSEAQPEAGFEQIEPDLEDVYFQRLRAHAKAA